MAFLRTVHPLLTLRAAGKTFNVVVKGVHRCLNTISTCPAPTCACKPMPDGLEIDRKLPLSGTMPAYHGHIVLATGRSDWKSRIEDDEGLPIVKGLKALLGPGAKFSNPFHNVILTASSLPLSTEPDERNRINATVLHFPSFLQISKFPATSAAITDFVQAFVLPDQLDSRTESLRLPEDTKTRLVRQPSKQSSFSFVKPITDVSVLICGHNARDSRCGILGPLLQTEFEHHLKGSPFGSQVTQISHIGGHKFAGNVIIYIPPTMESHPLRGKGIWYGRVEPRHIEGIVQKTIEDGVIIEDLFRGGIELDGKLIRI